LADLSIAPPAGHDDEPRTENVDEAPDSDIVSDNSQSVGAVEDLKLNEQRGNVIENERSRLGNRKRSENPTEKKGSYAFKAGMSLKRMAVGGVQRC
jgi:hypothetical protein